MILFVFSAGPAIVAVGVFFLFSLLLLFIQARNESKQSKTENKEKSYQSKTKRKVETKDAEAIEEIRYAR